jgi:heme A synthase
VSIREQDRPALDTLGNVLLVLALAEVIAAIATVINPAGAARYVLAALAGVYFAVVAVSCFLRGYRAQRERQAVDP